MVNYANNVCTPIVMSAPNSRFQINALKFADSLLEVTWQDNHLRCAASLSYAGDGMIEFTLRAGEMLVFNNQRLKHGRTAFDPANSKPHIRSCHVDLDEFYSHLRILYAKRQDPRRWITFRKDQAGVTHRTGTLCFVCCVRNNRSGYSGT